jgi:YD repeat-containing protein
LPLSLNEIKTYARSRGWKDLLFLAVLFSILCVLYNPPWGTDRAKWRRRTKPLALNPAVSNWKTGESGLAPCFFIVPSAATNQPAVSGTVGDCLLLVPDGRRLDLFEVPLLGGFIPVKTDIFVEDTIPLAFTRTYVPVDDWNRRFQVYVPDVYDPFLTGSRFPYTYLDWTLPDRKSIHYGRISPGTGFADAVYEAASFITVFAGSRVNWNGNGWDLSLESGTTYLSPEAYYSQRPQQGSLVGIFDGNGNEVRLSRQSNGDLTKIMSPNGRSIQLIYNEGRVSQLTDDSGDAVEYGYDVQSRLETVRFPNRQPIQYSYDASNRIVKVEDAQEGFTLQSKYDPQGYVTEIKLGDGRTYNFDYQRGNSDETFRVIIHDPEGQTTRVNVHPTKDRTSYTVDSGPSH